MKERLSKYCDPSRKQAITEQPWTTSIEGEKITFATNGHTIIVVPEHLPSCLELQNKKDLMDETYFGRKFYDKKISAKELKGFLGEPLWPPLPQECLKCKGSGETECPDCGGSGKVECEACQSEIACDCDDGSIDCSDCADVRTPVNPVWLDSSLVNGTYLSRVLEIFADSEVFFLLSEDPYAPIFLSDGKIRAAAMPMRADDGDDEQPKIKLNHIGPEKEDKTS